MGLINLRMIKAGIQSLKRLEQCVGSTNSKVMRYCILLSMFATIALYLIPYICGQLLDAMVGAASVSKIGLEIVLDVCTGIFLLVVIWYVATAEYKHRMSKISLAFVRRLRDGLDSKVMRVPVSFLEKMPPGDISSRFTVDVAAVYKLVSTNYTGFIVHVTMIIAILVMMFVTSPLLAIMYLVLMPLSMLMAGRITRISEQDFTRQKQMVSKLNIQMSDIISTHKSIKVECLEDKTISDFKNANDEFSDAFISSHIRSDFIEPLMGIMVNSGYFLTVIVGAIMLMNGMIQIGMFLTFMIYVRNVNTPLFMTVKVFDGIREEMISLDRVLEILEAPEEEESDDMEPFELERGAIEFDNVSFSYEDGKEIIHSVSFDVEPGKMTAIVGPTASGKTTLANLLIGLYPLDSGVIRIDGRDTRTISRSDLSRYIAPVLQNPWVFDGTIRENIVYNRPWIDEGEMIRISRITGLDDYVKRLPDGYDTYVGDDLRKLPLAQRRMLAMSRAFVGNPRIMVLDEAVAGLDPITGQAVINELRDSMKDSTIIVISHNPVLIEQADHVISIDDGRVLKA